MCKQNYMQLHFMTSLVTLNLFWTSGKTLQCYSVCCESVCHCFLPANIEICEGGNSLKIGITKHLRHSFNLNCLNLKTSSYSCIPLCWFSSHDSKPVFIQFLSDVVWHCMLRLRENLTLKDEQHQVPSSCCLWLKLQVCVSIQFYLATGPLAMYRTFS